MKGYLFIVDRCEVIPAYVEDPKNEFIRPGDTLLIKDDIGVIRLVQAVSEIQSAFTDRIDEERIGLIAQICGMKRTELPRVIGESFRNYWYPEDDGNEEKE